MHLDDSHPCWQVPEDSVGWLLCSHIVDLFPSDGTSHHQLPRSRDFGVDSQKAETPVREGTSTGNEIFKGKRWFE